MSAFIACCASAPARQPDCFADLDRNLSGLHGLPFASVLLRTMAFLLLAQGVIALLIGGLFVVVFFGDSHDGLSKK